ncbi:MAG: CBS domain-containing protein [Beijerinckiaceae bacterium]|nr:CBS domain-containing protein [Beijerinckiaceae bacterium]
MLVKQLLPAIREQLVTISDDAALIHVAKLLQGRKTSLVVVCNSDGVMAGVITKTDIIRQISHCQGNICNTDTSSVMTRDVTFCNSDTLLREAWSIMKKRGLKHIPVADEKLRPIGVLNARHVIQALLDEVENEEELLRDYVGGVGYQ